MPKERSYNPVQAQRKADKARAIKKGKADVAAARNERLSKKNPDRIRRQIEDLKSIPERGGKLTTHEEKVLEGLEKELKAVTKAREALGDRAPTIGRGETSNHGHDTHSGFGRKRRRDDDEGNGSSDNDVLDDVKRIPMPRDTPPPIPKRYLDEWHAKRRLQRSKNANAEPLGEGRDGGRGEGRDDASTSVSSTHPVSSAVSVKPVEIKTVYEAKPVIRDLQKEAVSAFIPTVVRRKLDKSRGTGGLLEPDEVDRLEREGYLKKPLSAVGENADNADNTIIGDKTGGESDRLQTSHPSWLPDTDQPRVHHATIEDVDDEEG